MKRPRILQAIAADIPEDLADDDQLLMRFGRWAMDRYAKRHCASAEGKYRAPPNEDDRQPREVLMLNVDAMRVQRALAKVPERERTVLEILYVPRRAPPAVYLRVLRIPPKLSKERHLIGLRMFSNLHRQAQHVERAADRMRTPSPGLEQRAA